MELMVSPRERATIPKAAAPRRATATQINVDANRDVMRFLRLGDLLDWYASCQPKIDSADVSLQSRDRGELRPDGVRIKRVVGAKSAAEAAKKPVL